MKDARQGASTGVLARPEEGVVAPRTDWVRIDQLHAGLSPRVRKLDDDHVKALMEVGGSLPPVLIHSPTMTIIDGIHRVEAARRSGSTCIKAVLISGDWSNAFVIAVQANVSHGKPLTLGERRSAAKTILADFADCSDRWLASICGLAPSTVTKIRAAQDQDGPPPGSRRVGSDGRRRPINPSLLRRRVAEAAEANPTASVRAIAAMVGAAPSTVSIELRRLRNASSEIRVATPDPAVTAVPELDTFVRWLGGTAVRENDWEPFVSLIPVGRLYEFADECRRRSESWSAAAKALEHRARHPS